MNSWRLIINEPLPASKNMAIDEAIINSVKNGLVPPTIRLYSWSPSAISLGYFQDIDKEVNALACQQARIDIVRRLTGGRAVLHQHELTYSLCAGEKDPIVAGSVLESYMTISRGLLKGLHYLGIEAELADGRKKSEMSSAACFDAPSWYEIMVQGKKLIGSAQTRRKGILLQHGSILKDLDVDLLFNLLNFKEEGIREKAKKLFTRKATSLQEILGAVPDLIEMYQAMQKGFEESLGIRLVEGALTAGEISDAEWLSQNKYGQYEWTDRKMRWGHDNE